MDQNGQTLKCPKCQTESGDSWSQCGGFCPMVMSPHYFKIAGRDEKMEAKDEIIDFEKRFYAAIRLSKRLASKYYSEARGSLAILSSRKARLDSYLLDEPQQFRSLHERAGQSFS
jgi:hypothetical protein